MAATVSSTAASTAESSVVSSSASTTVSSSASASSSSSGAPACRSDADCNDGIDCTSDTCDTLGVCRHDACDAECDDGIFCNGVERCDAHVGCAMGPPACELGLPCSVDFCTEAGKSCAHMQSLGCAPTVRLLVADQSGTLLSVSPYGGPVALIAASTGAIHDDVAILGGRWFAVESTQALVELVPGTNQIKASFPLPPVNSLGAGPDGQLYAAGQFVYRLDPNRGSVSQLGAMPPGYTSSGDVAFLGGKMFVSADGPCGGALVQFDPATGSAVVLGGDGLGCVYGLAVSGGVMFILDCHGTIGTFDPGTGVVRVLSTTTVSVYGAEALP